MSAKVASTSPGCAGISWLSARTCRARSNSATTSLVWIGRWLPTFATSQSSGAAAMRTLVDRLGRRQILVLVSGLQEQPRQVLERTGILHDITRDGHHLFDRTDDAIAHAHGHLANGDHTAPAAPVEVAPAVRASPAQR